MSTNQTNDLEKLGSVLGEFGWNKDRARLLLKIWGLLGLLCLPLSIALIGIPGLICSVYFVYRSLQRLKSAKPVVSLHQQGLVDYRQEPSTIVFYEEIKNLFLSVVITNGVLNYIVTLELQNRQKIKIDEHVANVDRLRTLLEEQLVQSQISSAIATYQQGGSISFGNLKLNQTGLIAGKRTLPWSDFESADVKRRSNFVELIIRQRSNSKDWFVDSRNTFPNLALFFALINYVTAPQNGTA